MYWFKWFVCSFQNHRQRDSTFAKSKTDYLRPLHYNRFLFLDVNNHKKTQSAFKKRKGRKRKRPKQNSKDQSEIGFDIKLLLKKEKGFSSLSQDDAKNVDKKKNNNDPDNSSTNVYNFTIISRTLLFQLLILLTTHYVLS